MTDQAQRLEIATVRAEIGSNITYRFNNDAIDAGGIPTESGDIKNLKIIIKEIEDKASVSSSIFTTVAEGLSVTDEGGMFLVQSDEGDEIYVVWRKVGGVAVDTGKRALSSQAIEAYMVAAGASADEAGASAAAAQSAADSAVSQFQDIVDKDDPYKGSAVVGRQPLQINTVAELRLTPGRFDGDEAKVKNYLPGDTKGADIPADWIVVQAPALPPADDGGMIIRVAGVSNAYWRRRLNKRGMVDGEVYGLPLAAGQDSHDKLDACMQYCTEHKIEAYLGAGPQNLGMFVSVPIYETFERSFPLSGPRVPGFPLVSFGFEVWSERNVTFQTTSRGADVFNLCSIADWSLRGFPMIKGFLLDYSMESSGSNAVSMVFGAKNVRIEARPMNMPQIWLGGSSSDGGHGFTVQAITPPIPPALDNINGYENVVFSGHVFGCTSGLNFDYNMDNSISHPIAGVRCENLVVEECYRGFTDAAPAPLISIVDPRHAQPYADLSGDMTIINCQQAVVSTRAFGGNMRVRVINTKEKEDLIVNPSDTSVEVCQVLGSKNGSLDIDARVLSVDKVLTLGDISMGGNAYPSVENFKFRMTVAYTTCTTEFDLGLASSPPCVSSSIELTGFVNVPSAFLAASLRTSLKLNGRDVTPTLYPGNGPAEPGPGAVVIFDTPLTAVQPVYAPPARLSVKGDPITVVRTAAATGGGVTFAGVSVAAGTRANFIYNGSAWVQYP